MAHVDTVIFDLGGVLIDWNPRYLYGKIFGNEKEIDFFLREVCHADWNRRQDGGRTFAEATEERAAVYPAYEEVIRCYFARWEEMLGGTLDNNVRVLEKLHQDKQVGLYAITNWSHETFPIALRKYNFLHYFKDIVVSGTEKLLKPEAAIYKVLLERNALCPEKCVFIDDVEENVEGARRLGIRGIHLKPDTDLSAELKKAGITL
ncbi:2-haloacid dehalogenase [Catalinimonas alkaloidigena]|uniref:HAD family hydrolase n=1 Tax=Catalinimonas alkaloidigena TaxID=1075417 RepID=UPI0024068EBA|nr:HAD family phosphatase [Catalinimonas alkaloidigena]MDF9800103.1 2-haloacid dehalogenase [Catalinimonas alkaloidigena]